MTAAERSVREGSLDQISRLVHGPYVYASLLAVLAWTTKYAADHPLLYWGALVATVASVVLRMVMLFYRETLYDRHQRLLQILLWVAVLLTSVSNGVLYVSSLLFYGFEDWTFTVLLIWTVGGASGATTTFTPTFRLLILHIALLLGPALVASLWLGGAKGNTFAIGTTVLVVYLVMQGLGLNRAYWKHLDARADEEMRLREVEAAKLAAEAANRAKSQFLANMSHELRTPMHGILGTAQVALGADMAAENREHLEVIHNSGQTLLQLLNEILDFSKVEAGKIQLESLPYSPRELLEGVRLAIAPQAQLKGLSLTWIIAEEVPQAIAGDPLRLRQVLLNLLGNAVKFTSRGSVGLGVDVLQEDSSGATLEFRVSDTGIGIPADKHELIFQAFAQADGSVTRRYGGTGLGLAISNHLVKLMGGKLRVESQPGHGSLFRFAIRAPRATLPPAGRPIAPPLAGETAGSGLRILMGEDNRINQRVARAVLEKRGHHVTMTDTGVRMLEAWEAGEYDVILIDNQMPEMGGVEAIGRLRESERSTGRRRTPAIMLTASAMAGDRERFLSAGLDGYLAKPFDAAELDAVLQQTIGPRHSTGTESTPPSA